MSDDAELDPLRVAFLVTHTFEALGVRYFIGGSLASIFHGLIRTTNDADLVAELAPSHVTALVAALEGARPRPLAPPRSRSCCSPASACTVVDLPRESQPHSDGAPLERPARYPQSRD